ncbi:MAG: NAD-dependent epimerase [Zoogloeaceae bacterium]|jgi:UDP-glucuronate 4-epimerase|nr:NAD-dependent epimerase [Zoogloeaceae bacterium]
MKILITGAAGFIGMYVAERLLARGDAVVGIDNLNAYYDVTLKEARLARLAPAPNFRFIKLDLADREGMAALFRQERPEAVIHLAAQAGVRYSLKNPFAYADSNLLGFVNVIEGCRQSEVSHLLYASSSSVYGGNRKIPFAEDDNVDHPVSLYAATKKANELMAYSYSHLYALPATGLRFFTVYGPWGRPDMAYFSFTRNILADKPIDVFNHGKLERDFTYVDDIAEGVMRVLDRPPAAAGGETPHALFNIGNHQPVGLMEFIGTLEQALGRKARYNFLPMQDGDVPVTYAETARLRAATGFAPSTPLAEGIRRFVDWYRDYYRVN